MKKQLLYLANLRMPTTKAYGIQIAKNCEAFARTGLSVELVVPYRPLPADATPIPDLFAHYGIAPGTFRFMTLPAMNWSWSGWLEKYAVIGKEFVSAWSLARYAKKQRADYVFSRDPYTLFILGWFGGLRNAFLEVHRFSPWRRKFYASIVRKGATIITTTENLKRALVDSGLPSRAIAVIPNGVDLAMFDLGLTPAQARARLNLPADKKIILYSGRLHSWKGVRSVWEEVQRLVRAKQLPDTEDWLFRVLENEPFKQIPLHLKAADVLVLPNSAVSEESMLYTSPLKMFEYMASQRPIVASRLPSITEILNDRNAILVEPDNAVALAAGITQALAGGPAVEARVKQAYADAQKYSLAGRAKKIIVLKQPC